MLRVTVELVPNEDEKGKRVLGQLEIVNLTGGKAFSDYGVRFNEEREWTSIVRQHRAADGAWALVARALVRHAVGGG